MPLFYQHNINGSTKLGVWHITEPEDFFLAKVPLQHDITHPHKRLQHLAGRYLLRFLFPGFPNELIRIAGTKKPFLADEAFHFSISHCGDYAAAIVSRTKRVGIDIEIPTPKVARVRHKFLHAEEQSVLKENTAFTAQHAATEDIFLRKLTLLWSAKEAVFKWYGNGKVDFSDQIRLQPLSDVLPIPGEGTMKGLFLKQGTFSMALPFINFKEICLVWVMT
ncbi:4'-phosphopantetheinyl transferase superfamily protein [Agriterribacter sp.]|uniref:4'-phosphopantetheinyl transferase family protein n=1 Tax=Agriterribacter sp. TaxID=2821509 RepID=UPI002D158689|nr:4'-phosphopantetheinyl transferase superfamily protein [Agriterribacter sp.]HRP55982.1 4'-phosphopantetheinyl transferase superfamily protein [Agriterribacter sp.]